MIRYQNILGVYDTSLPWVPTIAHILRRSALIDVFASFPPGKVLEFGCGSGAFLLDLERLGFVGKGVDVSAPALSVAYHFHAGDERAFKIAPDVSEKDWGAYDIIFSSEVLEHIEADGETLRSWLRCLKPGGVVILTVPAHRNHWGLSDEWAGHVRRYDKADIQSLVSGAHLELLELRSYGFPLQTLLRPIREAISRTKLSKRKLDRDDRKGRTSVSGVDRLSEAKHFAVYANRFSALILGAFCLFQRVFYRSDLGEGYIAVAHVRTDDV